jgi:hypothetical protein
MAPAKRKASPAVPQSPPPAGCRLTERADWLDAVPDVPALAELRARHTELANAWAKAVNQIAEVRWRHSEAERKFRSTMRDALAVAEPAPPRPPEIDPTQRDAEVLLATEDADALRDELACVVLDVLAALRDNRGALDLRILPPGLVRALTAGGSNMAAAIHEETRRSLAHLSEPPIIDLGAAA